MNFTTDLPKSRPFVTYIVASAVKCEKFFPNSKNEGPSFRMHAVILNRNGDISHKNNEKSTVFQQKKEYILCHIRKIDVEYKHKMQKNMEKCDKSSEEEKNDYNLDDNYDNFKPKKLKISENCENPLKISQKKEEFFGKTLINVNENVEIREENMPKSTENVKFRKMNLNLFQMFCVNQVIDRDFSNLVNEFCKIPDKKALFSKDFFPEVISKELKKKEENHRDYAKMFNLMS